TGSGRFAAVFTVQSILEPTSMNWKLGSPVWESPLTMGTCVPARSEACLPKCQKATLHTVWCMCTLFSMKGSPRIRIDLNSAIPATRQITDALRVQLVEGTLKPGASLPSVRRAAMELGVHFNTVAEAYRMLASEGWLDLKHGRGAIVVDREGPTASKAELAVYRRRLRELISQ